MKRSRQCSVSFLQRRAKPRLQAIALIILLTMPPLVRAQADTVARDAALCASLASGAKDALSLGYVDVARELLDEALSFVPSDPDSNYLRALLGLSSGESLASAIILLERSLFGGDFRLYEAHDARLLYASVLAKTRRPETALRALQGLPVSAEALFIETVASFSLGDDAKARTAVLSSLTRYPLDPRPLIYWLRVRDRAIRKPGEGDVLAAGFNAIQQLKELDPEILIALAPYAESSEEARLLVREFRALGHRTASATVLALHLGLISEERAINEMLTGSYIPSIDELEAMYAQLSSDASRQDFVSAFKTFSGLIVRDEDRDGIPEESVWYEGGAPERWILDYNQDGVPEIEVSFGSGLPLGLNARSGSVSLSLVYDSWPYLREAAFNDDEGHRRYSFGPAVFSFPAIDMRSFQGLRGAPYLISRKPGGLPSETAALRLAYAVHRSRNGIANVELHRGEPERAWWTDEFNRTGKTIFSGGVPDDERIDADGDGIFESRRVWRRNEFGIAEPAYIEMDIDGDGLYEYHEGLSGPRLRSWDYDGDGSLDMSLETLADGSLVYRYSGKDGLSELTYLDGSLVRVRVAGLPIPIIADSGGLVFWIGLKPFDFGASKPTMGRGSRNGVMYTVFEIEGSTYAEVLE